MDLQPHLATAPSAYLDPTSRVAMMSAIDAELERLAERAEIDRTIRLNGRDHHLGRLAASKSCSRCPASAILQIEHHLLGAQ